jgi:hypothetical protein
MKPENKVILGKDHSQEMAGKRILMTSSQSWSQELTHFSGKGHTINILGFIRYKYSGFIR